MAFGTKQVGESTPAWVGKMVAASTLVLQMLPPILHSSAVISTHTNDVLDLTFKIANVGIVVLALFFGVSPKSE